MNNPLQKSWSAIPPAKADTYLDNYPKYNKLKLASFLKAKFDKKAPRILEVGCGNLEAYTTLAFQFDFHYVGVDFSKPLIDAAKRRKPKLKLIYQDCFDYLREYEGPKYDVILISHVFELVESQDLLLHLCALKGSMITILWYEPPRYACHTVELKPSAHPHDIANAPYLRIKTSIDYYQHLLDKHKLKIIYKTQNPAVETDVLHVLAPK